MCFVPSPCYFDSSLVLDCKDRYKQPLTCVWVLLLFCIQILAIVLQMKKTCLYILPDSFSLIPVMIMIIFHNFGTKLHWFHEAFRLPICIVKRGRPIYRLADIYHFLIYRHRPISVFSNADLKSGTSAGSPVLLVRWNVRSCCMWKTKTFGRFNNSRGR